MKKLIAALISGCILLGSVSAFAVAENIIIDEETVTIPAEMGKICEVDDRTFVPVRFVSEYLGCEVNYNEHQQGVAITNPATQTSYYIMVGEPMLFVLPGFGSAAPIVMDTTPFMNYEESRIYIPIRFFAEAMNYEVTWDEATQTVGLTQK